MEIRPASPVDTESLSELMASVSVGLSPKLIYDTQPDYLEASDIQAEDPELFLAEDEVGWESFAMFGAGKRTVFVQGKPTQLRYLSDLRVDPHYRKGPWLARGFQYLKKHVFGPYDVAQTFLPAEDTELKKLLLSGRAGLPHFLPAGDYLIHHLVAPQRFRYETKLTVRQAKSMDAPLMQRLFQREASQKQFYPCYQFQSVGKDLYYRGQDLSDYRLLFDNKKLVGIVGIWDLSTLRRTIVRTDLNHPGQGWFDLSRRAPFPEPDDEIPQRFLHSIVMQNNDPELLRAALCAISRPNEDDYFSGFFSFGLDAADPLNEALRGLAKRTFEANHYLVSFAEGLPVPTGTFYADLARF